MSEEQVRRGGGRGGVKEGGTSEKSWHEIRSILQRLYVASFLHVAIIACSIIMVLYLSVHFSSLNFNYFAALRLSALGVCFATRVAFAQTYKRIIHYSNSFIIKKKKKDPDIKKS